MTQQTLPAQTTAELLQSVLLELASTASQGVAYDNWSDNFARKEVREVWRNLDAPLRRRRGWSVTIADLRALPEATRRTLGLQRFDDRLWVIPLWMVHYIADGESLLCISGETATKIGGDMPGFDLDVRAGCVAYGFTDDDAPYKPRRSIMLDDAP